MYKKLITSKYKNHISLGLILVFALILRLIFFTGIGSSDSLGYANRADMFAKGESIKEVAAAGLRIGIFLPVSVTYSIFGVNDFSSNILVLLLSLGSIVLIYNFGVLLFNRKVGLLSAFLLSFFPLDVVYSTRLMTDFPSAFFVALSVFFFLKSEKSYKKMTSSTFCLISGLSLGIAYLIKELSLLIGLFFIIYVLYHKKIKSRYFFILLGFVLIFSIEMVYFASVAGNPLFRYSMVNNEWADSIVATNMYGRGNLPFSLLHYPYIIFTDHLLGLFPSFIVIAIFYLIINKKKETYDLLFWFLPLLFYISFGSASPTRYIPIPAAARLLSIIVIPGILLLSLFLVQREPLIRKILMPSILILLITTSFCYIYTSDHRFKIDDEKKAYTYLKKAATQKQVYSDDRTTLIFDYLSGFKKEDNIKSFNNYDFLNMKNTYALNLSEVEDSYVVINRDLINFKISSKKGIKYPREIFCVPENWILEKVFEKKGKSRIELYYVP